MQYLTQDDVNNYGSDLIDVTQRAALLRRHASGSRTRLHAFACNAICSF